MTQTVFRLHGPALAQIPLVLDSPHSGRLMPSDFGSIRSETELRDRDGSSCSPVFTTFVRDFLTAWGYEVKINDPFKGAELIRAYADPASGRHSLQLEVNKRLYMDNGTLAPHAGFAQLQDHLMRLVDAITEQFTARQDHV